MGLEHSNDESLGLVYKSVECRWQGLMNEQCLCQASVWICFETALVTTWKYSNSICLMYHYYFRVNFFRKLIHLISAVCDHAVSGGANSPRKAYLTASILHPALSLPPHTWPGHALVSFSSTGGSSTKSKCFISLKLMNKTLNIHEWSPGSVWQFRLKSYFLIMRITGK